jgi:membrane protein
LARVEVLSIVSRMKRTRQKRRAAKWKNAAVGQAKIYWAALKKFNQDNGFFLASAITFNLLICLIPFMLLLLGIAGAYLYGDKAVLNYVRRYVENVIPSLDSGLMDTIWQMIEGRQIVGLLGFVGFLWTSSWVFASLRTALGIVFQAKGRGVILGILTDLMMVLGGGIFLLVSMILTSGITLLQRSRFLSFIGLGPITQWGLKYLVPFLFTFVLFLLLYKIVPNRRLRLRAIVHGALFSSLLWEVMKHLFGWYVLHLGSFSVLYGSLSTLAVFFSGSTTRQPSCSLEEKSLIFRIVL